MSICEKHRKFAEYWEEIGKPKIERALPDFEWMPVRPHYEPWDERHDYRIAGDRHWLLRKKWVDSDKTLQIERNKYQTLTEWQIVNWPEWRQDYDYREAVEKHEDICTDSAEEKPCLDNLGDSFIALGNALKDCESSISELTELASNCGLDLQFRIVAK
jgi:hypothetical protein